MSIKCTLRLSHDCTQWFAKFKAVPHSNLLQSYPYALAVAHENNQYVRCGAIFLDEQEAGIFLIQEARLLGYAIHAVILDRGPLWLDGFGKDEHFEAFVKAFNKTFPQRLGRKRRFIPEVSDSDSVRAIMQSNGFKHQKGSAYNTYALNLTQSTAQLRQGLKKNWRGALTKAEKYDLDLRWESSPEAFYWLVSAYAQDKKAKGYGGPSVSLLNALATTFTPTGDMMIGCAYQEGKRIASVMILCHGRSATYQVGWTSDKGRALGAHNLLLWKSIERLKKRDIVTFDLGGVHEETAKGVKKFKEGMGGTLLELSGLFT